MSLPEETHLPEDTYSPEEAYIPSPVERASDVVSGRWSMLIISELLTGEKRYTALKKAMPKVSPKMLSQRLKMLEEEGLLTRRLTASVPPRTDYRLTTKGRQLAPVVEAMHAYGAALLKAEAEARAAAQTEQGELF